ncbi:MAG: aminotransferase class I/II-fold pyridoxal phosphate-dependent enzyme [Solirubrobacteraceae bacterium]
MLELEARLTELRSLGLHRRTRLVSGPQGPHVLLDGRPVLQLCSSNYLGLADHPRVRAAAADAATRWGVGAGASRLASGTMTVHRRLEERLSRFLGHDSALLFGSGYLAAAGTIPALARSGDVVFSDELNRAALVDGCRLSGAEVFVYDHGDVEHLAWGISQAEGRGALIVTEGLFALTGGIAPLTEIVELADRFRLRTLVDDAHGIGALGPGGRGVVAEQGLVDQVDVVIGSLGKALGSYGGFTACDREMSRYLVNAARTILYSTAPAPPAVAGALAALALLEERPARVQRLHDNADVLRASLEHEGLPVSWSGSQIVTLTVPDAPGVFEAAVARGVHGELVGPPVVAPEQARLRLTVMATHRPEELRAAARTLAGVVSAVGSERGTAVPPPPALADAGEERFEAVSPAGPFDFEATEPVRRAA